MAKTIPHTHFLYYSLLLTLTLNNSMYVNLQEIYNSMKFYKLKPVN